MVKILISKLAIGDLLLEPLSYVFPDTALCIVQVGRAPEGRGVEGDPQRPHEGSHRPDEVLAGRITGRVDLREPRREPAHVRQARLQPEGGRSQRKTEM